MRVLITGASGFIGSHLARLLIREGCEVFALLRPESDLWKINDLLSELQIVKGDLLDVAGWAEQLQTIRPEICFHFAWYAEPGVFLTSPRNLEYLSGSLALATQLSRVSCRKLVVAGSFSEYDQEMGYLSESSPLRPNTLYGASKAALFQVLSSWASAAEIELLWPRIFSVYGPGEHPKRFVPAIILAMLHGEPTRLSPGEQVRDYLHVTDAVTAVWAAAQSNLTGPVNIASGKPVAIGDIARQIGVIKSRPDLIRLGDLPYREGDPMFICANIGRLCQDTGWSPRFSLQEGLSETLSWWENQISPKISAGIP